MNISYHFSETMCYRSRSFLYDTSFDVINREANCPHFPSETAVLCECINMASY
jgi:hypothetical protein